MDPLYIPDNDNLEYSPVKGIKHLSEHSSTHKNERHGESAISDSAKQKRHLSVTVVTSGNVKEKIVHSKERQFLYKYVNCGKYFNKKADLRRHVRQYEYHCRRCCFCFVLEKDFKQHAKTIHNEVLHTCTMCDFFSLHKYSLEAHFKRKHAQHSLEFACHFCYKRFCFKSNLNRHVWNCHSGTLLVKCNECNFVYKNLGSYKRHMEDYHYNKFACQFCRKRMSTQKNLETHLKSHLGRKKAKCPICNKAIRPYYLKSHMRIHTGVKPFVCPVCAKRFRLKHLLTRHVVVHTNTKPFVCEICNVGYRQRKSLIGHRESHGLLPPASKVSLTTIGMTFMKEYLEERSGVK